MRFCAEGRHLALWSSRAGRAPESRWPGRGGGRAPPEGPADAQIEALTARAAGKPRSKPGSQLRRKQVFPVLTLPIAPAARDSPHRSLISSGSFMPEMVESFAVAWHQLARSIRARQHALHRGESINAMWLWSWPRASVAMGYRFYSKFIAAKVRPPRHPRHPRRASRRWARFCSHQ